ncbi:MAG: HDIG domain-containing protein [Candidatus Krumholzibacteria bacterium]|nr:HDIG domain-containing protein [Candidatus Krumholzibacteria bacterium]
MAEKRSANGERRSSGSLPRRVLKAVNPAALRRDWRLLPFLYTAIFLALSIILFPPTRKAREIRFQDGDIADVDVIAPFTFIVPLSAQEIEINRAKAAVEIPPVYRLRGETVENLPDDLRSLMRRVGEIAAVDSLPPERRVEMIRDVAPGLSREPVGLLLEAGMRRRILEDGLAVQRRLFERGVLNDGSPLRRRSYAHITLLDGDIERLVPVTRLLEQAQLETVILEQAAGVAGGSEEARGLYYAIVRSHIGPNMIYDAEETQRRREAAVQAVQREYQVSKNQRIIAKHDRVTRRQVEMLEALERARTRLELSTSHTKLDFLFISKILRMLMLLAVFGTALYRFDRRLLKDSEKVTLTFVIVLFYLLLTALVVRLPLLDEYLIPVALVALTATAFFGTLTALIFTMFAALMIVTHTDLPASLVFISIIAGTAAIVSISKLHERRNFYTIFLYVSIAYIMGIASFSASQALTAREFLLGSLWGITSSFTCTILVMFLLPIFESLSSVTTNFTLMELSDLNRPLMKRLIMEAPGTYHHSLMVGNMVEAAAHEVKANGLLARVQAYYHDIGKLAKAEYFFENQAEGFNKHEKLAPTMSALILVSHVKEGVEMARREKLPPVVVDAIREHHGTTVMAFFYNKALEYDSHDSVKIDDFRYPGPRPQSKETALIMLADSCEAAVRSLRDPTAPRIRALVSRLFETRMNDGELDDSSLTLHDIAVIREQFIQFLTGTFHPRIQYPAQVEEEKESEGEHEDQDRQPPDGDRKKRV